MTKHSIGHVLATAALAAVLLPAHAGNPSQGDVSEQIQQRANALAADWTKHDAKAMAANYFTKDVTVHGEGNAQFVSGTAQMEKTLEELFKVAPKAKLDVHMAKSLGPDIAYGWVVWNCNYDQPAKSQFKVRSLYVFKKEGGQWKIAADSYSMGGIPK